MLHTFKILSKTKTSLITIMHRNEFSIVYLKNKSGKKFIFIQGSIILPGGGGEKKKKKKKGKKIKN